MRGIVACVAVLGVSVVSAGCGSEEPTRELTGEPFSAQENEDFTKNLDDINALVDDGDCEGAQNKLAAVTEAAENVPAERDEGLVDDLISLLSDLDAQIAEQCTTAEPAEGDTTETDEEPPTESTTTTPTTDTSSTETVPDEEDIEDEEEPEDPEDLLPDPPVEPPVTPGNSGGVPPGQGGVSPSGGSFDPERRGTPKKPKKPKKDKS